MSRPDFFLTLRVLTLTLGVATLCVAGRQAARAQAKTAPVSGLVVAVSETTLPAVLSVQTSFGVTDVPVPAGTQFEIDEDEDPEFDFDADEEARYAANPQSLVGRFVDVRVDDTTGQVAKIYIDSLFQDAGVVTSVREQGGKTLATVDLSFAGPVTVEVKPDTVLTADGESVQNARDLRGLLALLDYDPTTLTANRIEASHQIKRLRGRIVSYNPDTEGMVVSVGGASVHVLVQDLAFVMVDFQPADLTALQAGQDVVVEYAVDPDFDGKIAVVIQALTPATTTVTGTVGDVSATGQTLTLAVPTGQIAPRAAKPAIRLVKITPATRITLNGKKVPLARVPRGARIQAKIALKNGLALARTLVARRK